MTTSRLSAALSLLLAVELVPVLGLWLFMAFFIGLGGIGGNVSRNDDDGALAVFLTVGAYASAWCLVFLAARSAGTLRHLGVVICCVAVASSLLGTAAVARHLGGGSGDPVGSLADVASYFIPDVAAVAALVAIRSRSRLVRSAAIAILTIAGCAGAVFVLLPSPFDGLSIKFWIVSLALAIIPFTALGLVLSEDATPAADTTDSRAPRPHDARD